MSETNDNVMVFLLGQNGYGHDSIMGYILEFKFTKRPCYKRIAPFGWALFKIIFEI